MSAFDFKGKTILVTGAGAGIGKAIVEKLVSSGANVIAVSLLQTELDALVQQLPSVQAIQADLRDWAGTKRALQGIGKVHGLVNNAGVALNAPFLEVTEEQFDLTFDLNVKAVINVSQIVAKSMLDNGIKGSIVNISSIAALTSMAEGATYCSSKGGLQALTRAMALELGQKGIRVNSVNPTLVKTNLSRFLWQSDAINTIVARTPLGRIASPGEVANAVAFLLSDQALMINGIPLPVDGGYLKGLVDHLVYCGSKSAVNGVTRVMALELGSSSIRVNAVNPTVVMTDLGRQVWADPKKQRELLDRLPLGHFAEVDDVASVILYLLSEESSMITGTCLPVDGGYNIA